MQTRISLATSILIVCGCQGASPFDVKPKDNGQTGSASNTIRTVGAGYVCVERDCAKQWQAWVAKPYHLPTDVKGSDVKLRFAHCWAPDSSSCGQIEPKQCRVVAAIDGRCYANDLSTGRIGGAAYDCSMSDEAILGQRVAASATAKLQGTGGCGGAGSEAVDATGSGGSWGNWGSGSSGGGAAGDSGSGASGSGAGSGASGSGASGSSASGSSASGSGASGSGASGSGASGSGNAPNHSDLPPETACEQTVEEFCAAPSAGYPPCIMDWADADDPAKWCSADVYVSVSSCSSGYNEIDRIVGSGDNELFAIYYYDQASGRLVHISRIPVPSQQNCVAGDRTLRQDELGCVMTSGQRSCGP